MEEAEKRIVRRYNVFLFVISEILIHMVIKRIKLKDSNVISITVKKSYLHSHFSSSCFLRTSTENDATDLKILY